MSAVDAQLIDQLKWGDEKICAVHHVPPFMVGVGPLPSYNNVEALGQQYYGQCLQYYFESIELCLTEGLEVARAGFEVEFDISELDRMDSVQRMEVATKGVTGGVFKPNDARAKFNLPAVDGGDQVFLQRQNWPLVLLGSDTPPPPQPVVAQPDQQADAPMPPMPKQMTEAEIELRSAAVLSKELAA
jgi:phage portal protein BeeE